MSEADCRSDMNRPNQCGPGKSHYATTIIVDNITENWRSILPDNHKLQCGYTRGEIKEMIEDCDDIQEKQLLEGLLK